jgi:hypothetical protein
MTIREMAINTDSRAELRLFLFVVRRFDSCVLIPATCSLPPM